MTKDDVEIILEDLDQLVEYARDNYTIAGFLSVANSATMLREAMIKRIERKPTTHSIADYSNLYLFFHCNNSIDKRNKYCPICGQKISWS